MKTAAPPRPRGFTLLEILVALVIFGLMTLMAYRGLDSILKSREQLARETGKWRGAALLLTQIARDIEQALPRPAREGAQGEPFTGRNEAGALLEFTRVGEAAQPNVLAAPLRCRYRLRGARVERLLWPATDAAPGEATQIVGDGVARLEFDYLDAAGEWHAQWPPAGTQPALPSAVQVRLELSTHERITRLIALPEFP